MDKTKTVDSKFVQQHLANERTFLAWIRTSIAMVGLGFLTAGVAFQSSPYYKIVHTIAAIIAISSIVIGGFVIAYATMDYLKKQKGINNETFRAPVHSVLLVFACLFFIILVLMVLISILMWS